MIQKTTRSNGHKWIVNLDIDYFFIKNPHHDNDQGKNDGEADLYYQFRTNHFVHDTQKN